MTPKLWVVVGNAGTGKTTWARSLARRYEACLLDLDTVSGALVTAAQTELGRPPWDRDSAEYKRVFREPVHETLFAIARESHASVIIVAPFTRERAEPHFRQWVEERTGMLPEVHYFYCDEEIRRERLELRGEARDSAKFENYADYAAIAPRDVPPPYPHLWYDTSTTFPNVPA